MFIAPAVWPDEPAPAVLPPMRFVAAVAGDELFQQLHRNPRFARLSNELIGCPIELHAYPSYKLTSGGKAAGFASVILAAGTLGLLPLVTNGDLTMTYDLVVNGSVLSSYVYRKNFTRSANMYRLNTAQGLDPAQLDWAKTTADQFLADIARDEKLAGLAAEYEFYFGAGAK
jgi:hypothetical protein